MNFCDVTDERNRLVFRRVGRRKRSGWGCAGSRRAVTLPDALYDSRSVPGTGEDPVSTVYADAERVAMLSGDNRIAEFKGMIEGYVERHYSEYDMVGGTRASERKKGKKGKKKDREE